ncbi:MAG: translation initiation factor IF-2 subunit gamma [Candidatus Parvarchaeota archaeon]|nr:translation initiation factor IF-2 subunit gamma [Candidatus Jingweiarchaeum tengchongense]MCW1300285.1 translation initiation factor IF-2 subunit gamma [Candidatus Jingweiarchaeum tengchongense]MCW1304479.1 translation initiation factor IF-2 subunit gamma [Candidatus Jingweiarchaeum tengchongense]MCW1305791.1 translation initiation factor IF-2 subunit gamma [Candidatus Jingweiarchaeum tengchongense]MCW1310153.1 translation initiation factor IF-2 subunit gamma [Candidatus Jingweiarchaeum ten
MEKDISQPEVNIGLVGHIGHGKTTICYALTGKLTLEHSEELMRGITIRLGYADAIIRKCESCDTYTTKESCPNCGNKTAVLRKISFVDAPGHETLMATMLTGSSIINGAILVIAADEPCPQPQTKEHLMALEICGIKNIIIVQNKVDLVGKEAAIEHYKQIKDFVKGTIAENAVIIPMCAQANVNVDLLIRAIQEFIPTPKIDTSKEPIMLVARSFDVNPPGTDPSKLVGGVLGGILKQGELKVGDKIEIRPGIKIVKQNKEAWEPLITEITSLSTGDTFIQRAIPGGNIGVATKLDPFLTKADSLAGSVIGKPGAMPPVFSNLKLEVHLLKRVVGTKEELEIKPLSINEILMINAWTAKTVGTITKIKGEEIELVLKIPVCIFPGEKVVISRRIENHWRLVGYGIVK